MAWLPDVRAHPIPAGRVGLNHWPRPLRRREIPMTAPASCSPFVSDEWYHVSSPRLILNPHYTYSSLDLLYINAY